MRSPRVAAAVLLALPLAVCSAAGPAESTPPGAAAAAAEPAAAPTHAALDPGLVSLAASAKDVTRVKIRATSEGGIAKVSVYHGDADRIPAAVHELAKKEFADGKARRFEHEHYAGEGAAFEVEVEMKGGKICEVSANEAGELRYTECRIEPKELPAAATAAIEKLVPEGKILEAEEKKSPAGTELTVEVEASGQEHYIIMSAEGEVKQHLLRIPAILEVPVSR